MKFQLRWTVHGIDHPYDKYSLYAWVHYETPHVDTSGKVHKEGWRYAGTFNTENEAREFAEVFKKRFKTPIEFEV